MQPVPETTGPDVVVEEEIVEIRDNGTEQDQAEGDKESAILSMIQVYQEANAPPPAPDTPCQTCTTQGEASREQSTDTKMTNAVALLLLSYPSPQQRWHCHQRCPSDWGQLWVLCPTWNRMYRRVSPLQNRLTSLA